MIRRIIVLCTGNICRSPMGEALLRERLIGRDFVVASAGTGALAGASADEFAQQVMRQHGIDIASHRARQATLKLLSDADLILTMDATHGQWVDGGFPQLRGRVHKLLKWRDNRDVADPYQLPLDAFEQAYADISSGIGDWLKHLAPSRT